MDTLAITLWTAAAAGLVSVGIAIIRPQVRPRALLGAAILFLPIGIAGILSVGVLFLLLSIACLIAAARSRKRPVEDPPGKARR